MLVDPAFWCTNDSPAQEVPPRPSSRSTATHPHRARLASSVTLPAVERCPDGHRVGSTSTFIFSPRWSDSKPSATTSPIAIDSTQPVVSYLPPAIKAMTASKSELV